MDFAVTVRTDRYDVFRLVNPAIAHPVEVMNFQERFAVVTDEWGVLATRLTRTVSDSKRVFADDPAPRHPIPDVSGTTTGRPLCLRTLEELVIREPVQFLLGNPGIDAAEGRKNEPDRVPNCPGIITGSFPVVIDVLVLADIGDHVRPIQLVNDLENEEIIPSLVMTSDPVVSPCHFHIADPSLAGVDEQSVVPEPIAIPVLFGVRIGENKYTRFVCGR